MDYGVIPGENNEYHLLDENKKLLCTHFAPEEMLVVSREKTFGKELCSECRRRQ